MDYQNFTLENNSRILPASFVQINKTINVACCTTRVLGSKTLTFYNKSLVLMVSQVTNKPLATLQ